MSGERILIVEDERAVARGLEYGLDSEGFTTLWADTGQKALQMARHQSPDLILLDLRLPDVSGLDICRELRAEGQRMPILMLTARDEELDKVLGLELGADDYVVKPFSVRELMARVKSVLRRTAPRLDDVEQDVIRAGELTVDPIRHEARWRDVELPLTALEFGLLQALARHAGQVMSREQLLQQVWGYDYLGDLRAVDAAVKRLRAKLRQTAPRAEPIVTVRGVGYKLLAQGD